MRPHVGPLWCAASDAILLVLNGLLVLVTAAYAALTWRLAKSSDAAAAAASASARAAAESARAARGNRGGCTLDIDPSDWRVPLVAASVGKESQAPRPRTASTNTIPSMAAEDLASHEMLPRADEPSDVRH